MSAIHELETERLLLRQWSPSDFPAFAEMNACPEVMEYFPSTLTRSESDSLAARISKSIAERGWGLWALEEKQRGTFLGFTGLSQTPELLPFDPAIEVGWRLSKQSWGNGYATEAATRALEFAFDELGIAEVVSFTSTTNVRSQAVMLRVGMSDTCKNFGHPSVPVASDLHQHVLYRLTKEQWRADA